MLVIKTISDLKIFNNKYGKYSTYRHIPENSKIVSGPYKQVNRSSMSNKPFSVKIKKVNWKKVSEDYGGIEICPYFSELVGNNDYFWYWSFDAASSSEQLR